MITQIGGVVLTDNIAAINSLGEILDKFSKEYYTIQAKRFMGFQKLSVLDKTMALCNLGEGGELLLLEKIIIYTPRAQVLLMGAIDSMVDWESKSYGYCMKTDEDPSVIGSISGHDDVTIPHVFGELSFDTLDMQVIDLGGVIIPNGHGFGVGTVTDPNAKFMPIWREIS